MPKNISFRKPDDSPDVTPLNEEELLRQHQKKLEKSNVDALISKTKGELVGIQKVLMAQQNDEREAERRKMFSTVQPPTDAASKIQAIKKASIFAGAEYKKNIQRMMEQSEEIKFKLEKEEKEKERIKL